MNKKILNFFGVLLLSPAVISVFLFFFWLLFPDNDFTENVISKIWLGTTESIRTTPLRLEYQAVALPSYIPVYIGLMGLAGAIILIKSERQHPLLKKFNDKMEKLTPEQQRSVKKKITQRMELRTLLNKYKK